MKRYEGLFILDIAGKEDTLKDVIDRLTADITAAGGKIETVQKMDKRNFSRVSQKRHTAGFYVNVIFEAQPAIVATLRNRFVMNSDVFRVLFTVAPPPPEIAAAPAPQ